MICFEVFHNGEKLCTASVGDYGVLTTDVTLVSHHPEKLARWQKQGIQDLTPMELHLQVGGLVSDEKSEHLKWVNDDLSVGDEICIRIIESAEADPPEDRYHRDPETELKQAKEYVIQKAKEFGWEIRTNESPASG